MSSSQAYTDWSGKPDGQRRQRNALIRRVPSIPGSRLRRWRTLLRTALVLLPTIAAIAYYGVIASDRYVSEARFVVRTANKPANVLGGLSALLQLVGMTSSQDDAYAVRDFLTSRDAMRQLIERLPLAEIYARPGADWLTRYPSALYGGADEEFYLYFQHMLSVVVNYTTGLATLRVEAFRAEDAHRVAETLLGLGEDLVNRLNTRMQNDAVRVAEDQLARAEQRRIQNQVAVTAFRNRALLLDPTKNSAIVVELIGKLSAELAEDQAQIADTKAGAPGSPQLQPLRQAATALARQIALERARVADNSDGLAEQIAQYERLMLEREFSIKALDQSQVALETARVDARRQQLFLERVVEPGLPDQATMPRRWRMVLTVFGFNVIGWGVLWLIWEGLQEHGAKGRMSGADDRS